MADLYQDLLKDTSESFEDGNYFLVTILDLELSTLYPLQFKWKYKDGTVGKDWSAVYQIITPGSTVPNEPDLKVTDVTGGAGFITVTWNGKDSLNNNLTNIDRVDVHISGTSFGDGTKPAGSFKSSGTQTFAATPGIYIVQLKAISVNGAVSFFSTARTVTVTTAGEVIQAPTNPNGFSSRRILAGLEVSWAGTYSDGTFTGFEAIKIYAGTSASATVGTYTEVGVLTGNNVKNTIIVPVDGTYVAYGQAVYIHAAAVNKNGTVGTIQANVTNQLLGPGKATDADINDGAVVISKLASDVLTVGNLKAGDINATSYIRAGSSGSARVEISSSTVGTVLPGLTVYASDGSQLLRAPLTGGLSITGSLTATQISTSSNKFRVDTNGILTASDVDLTGTIKANGGNIGGIIIASDAIQNGATSGTSTFRIDSSGMARFGSASNSIIINPSSTAGALAIYHSVNGSSSTGTFSISNTGVITATSGTIGGWTLGPTSLSGGSTTLNSNGIITGADIRAATFTSTNSTTGGISIQGGSGGNSDSIYFYRLSGTQGQLYASETGFTIVGPQGGSNHAVALLNSGAINIRSGTSSTSAASITFASSGGSVASQVDISVGSKSFRNIVASTSAPDTSTNGAANANYLVGEIYLRYT